jgi:hypothetical protein
MNWTTLIGPAVVAALIIAAMTERRLRIDLKIAKRRFCLDRELAERKYDLDKQLADHKAKLDASLAERKMSLDRELAIWRRRYDLAEQMLSAAYEARDALGYSRGRLIRAGEGKTRAATEPESDKVREARDTAFIPIERLAAHSKAFANLQALQDSVLAHLGLGAARPISTIFEVHHSITTASSILVQMADGGDDRSSQVSLQPLREELWGDKAKETNSRIDAAVEQLEAICKPILSAQAPA